MNDHVFLALSGAMYTATGQALELILREGKVLARHGDDAYALDEAVASCRAKLVDHRAKLRASLDQADSDEIPLLRRMLSMSTVHGIDCDCERSIEFEHRKGDGQPLEFRVTMAHGNQGHHFPGAPTPHEALAIAHRDLRQALEAVMSDVDTALAAIAEL